MTPTAQGARVSLGAATFVCCSRERSRPMPDQADEGDLDILIQTGINDPIAIGLAEDLYRKQESPTSPWIEMWRHARRAGISSAGGMFVCQGSWKPRLARYCEMWRKRRDFRSLTF